VKCPLASSGCVRTGRSCALFLEGREVDDLVGDPAVPSRAI